MTAMQSEGIGVLNEQSLHASLKECYAGDSHSQEVRVDGYIIDAIRGNQLIEIQTQHFTAIRKKIFHLINKYSVLLVYPVAQEKMLVKLPRNGDGEPIRRKSPKRGAPYKAFTELVSFPELVAHPNFALEIVMVDVEEVRRYSGKRTWRQNGWVTVEQRLVNILETITIQNPTDYWRLLPETLPGEFTSSDLQKLAGMPIWLAQKTAYCLRKAGVAQITGKRGRFNLYQRTSAPE